MKNKLVTADCTSCESVYAIEYTEELSSKEMPEFCAFCGEPIEDITEEFSSEEELEGFDDSSTWE